MAARAAVKRVRGVKTERREELRTKRSCGRIKGREKTLRTRKETVRARKGRKGDNIIPPMMTS